MEEIRKVRESNTANLSKRRWISLSFITKFFGPSKEEAWKQFSREIGGEFIEGKVPKEDRVVVKLNGWTITLDTYMMGAKNTGTPYTRMTAYYLGKDAFRFKIYRKTWVSKLDKSLGMQDTGIGDSGFDQQFIIKANDEHKVRDLLANPKISQLIMSQPSINLQIKGSTMFEPFPEEIKTLYFEAKGTITDIERLKALLDLFAEVLNQLCYIGSASEEGTPLDYDYFKRARTES